MSDRHEMDRLERAMELWLRFRAGESSESSDELLADHEDLRDLLEAFLSDEVDRSTELSATAPLQPAPDAAATERTLGEFRLIEEIGRGGMGVVYSAWQASLDRHVALKVLPAHSIQEPKAIARFKREARTAAKLDHEGIVEIFSVASDDELHYFAMELIDGAPLDLVIAEASRLGLAAMNGTSLRATVEALLSKADSEQSKVGSSATSVDDYPRACASLIATVADALHYAHEAGVVHRDVKPANILVRRSGAPVVTDFGLAFQEELPALTVTGDMVGTPYYLSPEQILRRDLGLDRRTDIFSLGTTLYELLTLRRPFNGETSLAVLQDILRSDPPDPTSVNPSVPADLSAVVGKAMEKDRDRRYATAEEFATDLRNCVARRPVTARRLTRVGRALRWTRREPAKAALAITLTVIVPALSVILAIIETEARREAKHLTEQERLARIEAEQRATEAKTVTDFLVSLFSQADPYVSLGEDLPVGLMLHNGTERIEAELADQPAVQARLLGTVGGVYASLFERRKAVDLLRRSLSLRRELGTADSDEGLRLRLLIAVNLMYLGEREAAASLLADALELGRDTHGGDSSFVAHVIATQGLLASVDGEPIEAERLLRESVEIQRRVRPQVETKLAHRLRWFAEFLDATNRHDEARALLAEALSLQRRLLPATSPELLDTLLATARNLAVLGDDATAAPLVREALALAERVFGADHPRLATALITSGYVDDAAGRVEPALEQLQRAYEIGKTYEGFSKAYAASTFHRLGQVHQTMGRYEEARELLSKALAASREAFPGDRRYTGMVQSALAEPLVALGDFDAALENAREALTMIRRVAPDGPEHARAVSMLVFVLAQFGAEHAAEAKQLARTAIAIADKWPNANWSLARAHVGYALILNQQGSGELAEESARRAIELYDSVRRDDHHAKALALYQLGWALLLQKQPERSAANFEASIAMFRRLSKGGVHADIAWPLSHYGLQLFEASRYEDARPYLEEAYAVRREALEPASFWRMSSAAILGVVYRQLRAFEQAEPLLVEVYDGMLKTHGGRAEATVVAIERLVDLYAAWGKPDLEKKYRALLSGR